MPHKHKSPLTVDNVLLFYTCQIDVLTIYQEVCVIVSDSYVRHIFVNKISYH